MYIVQNNLYNINVKILSHQFNRTKTQTACEPDHERLGMLYGIVQCTNFNNYQSSCVFQCNNGYFITGYSTLTCESNGDGTYSWNHEAPVCVGELEEIFYLKYFLTFCLFYSWNHEASVCVGEY